MNALFRVSSCSDSWEDGELLFSRGWRGNTDGSRQAVLVVQPATEHPTPASLDRLAHEYALRDKLGPEWAVRPLALESEGGRTTLVLNDGGGQSLTRLLGAPLEIGAFLRLAVSITSALGKVHQHGLVHKDLKPAHILVMDGGTEVRLTGFGLASLLSREHQAPEPPDVIAGTLAYMAPEQTGRMNRATDSRSDLYALGVTLYELMTGTLPFTTTDPIELIHSHIAREPAPPSALAPRAPEQVSSIVMKLLAKAAEDRYQTAAGLEADLRTCLSALEETGRIEPFPLAASDAPDRLPTPERLYGRESQVATLLTAFDRAASSGETHSCLCQAIPGSANRRWSTNCTR